MKKALLILLPLILVFAFTLYSRRPPEIPDRVGQTLPLNLIDNQKQLLFFFALNEPSSLIQIPRMNELSGKMKVLGLALFWDDFSSLYAKERIRFELIKNPEPAVLEFFRPLPPHKNLLPPLFVLVENKQVIAQSQSLEQIPF